MRKKALSFLVCCTLCVSVYAQEGRVERDSLPVFVIQDRELASIVDDFIVNAQKLDQSQAVFNIYIRLLDIGLSDEIHLLLNLREQSKNSDSLILYKNPHFHQAFILHCNVLFRANITSYSTSFNYHLLTGMLKVLPEKQAIYFKDPPPDFYDLNLGGGHPMNDTLLDSFHEYDGTEWHYGIRMFEDDRKLELIEIK